MQVQQEQQPLQQALPPDDADLRVGDEQQSMVDAQTQEAASHRPEQDLSQLPKSSSVTSSDDVQIPPPLDTQEAMEEGPLMELKEGQTVQVLPNTGGSVRSLLGLPASQPATVSPLLGLMCYTGLSFAAV